MEHDVVAVPNAMHTLEIRGKRAPGILVLSPNMTILHLNQTARILLGRIEQMDWDGKPGQALPSVVTDLATEIREVLALGKMFGDGQMPQVERTLGGPTQKIALRVIGLPNSKDSGNCRILVLLEPETLE